MLNQKLALVTGASRGIGKAIAAELGQMGATIAGTATSPDGAESITKQLHAAGLKGAGYHLDISQPASINDVITAIQNDFGVAPLILVNNAGITRDNILLRMKDEQWQDVINTNLTGTFHVTKACLKGMLKERWGRVISITSVVAMTGNMGQANYAAAKAGLIGFTKSSAIELASRNITFNCVAPGFVETDMTKDMDEKHREYMLNLVPQQRMATPEEIAYAVGFLASPRASYITGETIHVNGGMYMS